MSKDQLMLDVDQAGELKAMFRREGWTNKAIKTLCEKKGLGALFLDVLEGRSEIKAIEFTEVDLDADPFIPKGWSVAKNDDGTPCHKKGGKIPFNPNMVELYLSNEQKNSLIQGNNLRKKVEAKNPYNANLLDFYLAHTELIPERWKGQYVFFWGTIYRNADGRLCVRFLFWDGDRWNWGYCWLSNAWRSNSPSAVPGR